MIGLGALVVLFVLVAIYYVATPAESLLHFMPGYEAGVTDHHTKHAIAALLLAAGCGVLLWFSTGKKATPTEPSEPEE